MDERTSLIRLDGVGYRYPLQAGAGRAALRGVDLEVGEGDFLVVLGASGAGKTTLAGILAGVLKPTEGSVSGLDALRPGSGTSLPAGLVTENPEDTFTSPVVREEMGLVLQNLDWEDREIDGAVEEMLRETGLAELAESHPAFLSGGQKQLLAAASILVAAPRLLVLDEPLSLLDHRAREEVSRLLARRRPAGGGVVYLSSDVRDARRGDRAVVLADGTIAWRGPSGEIPLDSGTLSSWGLRAPDLTALASLLDEGPPRIWHPRELAETLCRSR